MKTKVLCIIAGAVLALSVSFTAAAGGGDEGKSAPAQTEKPKAVVAAKPTGIGPAPAAQQNKMKHCNDEARKKELKGDERRAFMSTCLKG